MQRHCVALITKALIEASVVRLIHYFLMYGPLYGI